MRYLLIGLLGLLTLGIVYSCQKETSLEYGSSAKGSLQSSAGDCLPKTVAGAYIAAKTLNDSNYIEVTVNVTTAGPYTISTDTVNGYAFKTSGTFSNTGSNIVRLKGSGKPVAAGTDGFTVVFDTSACYITVTVLPAGSSGAATYTLAGSPAACASFTQFGNFIKDTVLDARHYIKVDANVTTPGTYSITTNTVNGYSFSGSGTFGATGTQTIVLQGTGKPLAAGTDAFTVTAGTSTCTFSITVTATAPQSCNPAVQGTYTVGTAATAANKVTLTHTYTTAGTYTVSTNTLNGYSFSSPFTATAGSNTVTINATGTPALAGTNSFTVDFGDGQTCSFNVTVAGVPNTDYFPTTLNSYWTYDDGTGVDTFKMTVTGPITINTFNGPGTSTPTIYQKFTYTGYYIGDEYYRKDAGGNYFQLMDTAGWGKNLVFFNQPNYEVRFLQNALTTGSGPWFTDIAITYQGVPTTLRYKYTCPDANATLTVNGKTFTNLYKVQQTIQVKVNGVFVDGDGPYNLYYGKGIGLVYWEDASGSTPSPIQALRNWIVN